MAGFDNEVMFALGERLQASTAQAIQLMQQTATDVSNINHTGDPNGVVAANPSSLSHDPVSGNIYMKQTGTGNTGWALVGQSIQTTVSFVDSSSAVALTTATPTDVTSISLPAGTYSISGIINFTGTGTVTGAQIISINTTSATIGNQGDNVATSLWTTLSFVDISLTLPSYILTIGTTTTVYLIAEATFSTGSYSAYGRISAIKLS